MVEADKSQSSINFIFFLIITLVGLWISLQKLIIDKTINDPDSYFLFVFASLQGSVTVIIIF